MPMYPYEWTDAVGGEFEEFQHMSENPFTEKDGRPCCRTVPMFQPITRFGKGNQCDLIEMLSIAVDTRQDISDFRQRNPGVQISSAPGDPLYGVPIASSRAEKLRILDAEGFVEAK